MEAASMADAASEVDAKHDLSGLMGAHRRPFSFVEKVYRPIAAVRIRAERKDQVIPHE